MASEKKRKKKRAKVKIKKRCCESKRPCAGCPLRPENRDRAARSRPERR